MINVLQTVMRRYIQKVEGVGGGGGSTEETLPLPPREPPSPSPVSDSQSFNLMSSGIINSVIESSTSTATTTTTPPILPSEDHDHYISLLQEVLRMLLTVFNITLRPSLIQNNLRVVHYLLYSQRELIPYFRNPIIADLGFLGNIPVIMEHFSTIVEAEQETLSVERAMELLEKGARTLVTR